MRYLALPAFLYIPNYFWHPLQNGPGYNVWSGILGSFLFSLPGWLVALAIFLRHRNCHVHRCWRPSWHTHPDHGHPVCRIHHPDYKHEKLSKAAHE